MSNHASRVLSAVLYAADLKQVAAFYAAVLELEPVEETGEFIVLARGPAELVVVQAPASVAPDGQTRSETPIKLSFAVADLGACRSRVTDNGGSLKPMDAAWNWQGVRHLDGVDPEGNVFQLRSV